MRTTVDVNAGKRFHAENFYYVY